MSFLQDLPCHDPASFSSMQQRKMPDRTTVAHDVPLRPDEKTIIPDRTPFFLRMLQSEAAKKASEDGLKSKKWKRRHDKDEDRSSPNEGPRRKTSRVE